MIITLPAAAVTRTAPADRPASATRASGVDTDAAGSQPRDIAPTRPYRILLTTWQDFGAGSVRSVQYLAEGLIARGHMVRVACPAEGVLGSRLIERGVPVDDFGFGRGWSLGSARRIAALVRTHGIELLDAQESRDRKAAIVARAVLRLPVRLVITRRQMSASFPLENAMYGFLADRVIAISHGVAQDLERRGTPARKISVVHTGLDPGFASRPPDVSELGDLRAELELDPAIPTIAVVARRKDQETLLRALTRLQRPVNVLFVGINRDESLARLEPGLAAGTRVAYTGFRDRVLPFYSLLDIKVLTTQAEGLSQAILESMATGTPVISAAVGGTPEVVQHRRNGLLFAPGNDTVLAEQLTTLLADSELRTRLIAEGYTTVRETFHADALARGTEIVYRSVLEGAP